METIDKFLQFAESLKLVRNDQVEINGKFIIDEIYTDLLPNNGVLNKVNLPRTTVLVGRKGTGKSTIFQKSQHEIDKNKKYLSIYIDVKSLYDNSTPTLPPDIEKLPESEELVKYLIYSNFIKEIILRTKEKLTKRVEKNYIVNVLGLSEVVLEEVFIQLDDIEQSIDAIFKKLNSSLITCFKNTLNSSTENSNHSEMGANTTEGLSLKAGESSTASKSIKREFDNTLVTYLDLKKCFIDNIVKIREILKIKTLYIYLDDYSEIDKYAQSLFMDWFIAPVNNLSDDFVKFKIATYPKRFYYGKLDNSKIDEISLDFFDAFYSIEKKSDVVDISRMEHLALDYTQRLMENRFNVYFPNNNWTEYFSIKPKELYEMLFNVTLNTPRKMGYILSYCYESSLIHGTKIGVEAIENAALRYYTDIIEKYFLVNEFICKPFEDKISNEHQYELLNKLVNRQVNNKKYLSKRQAKDTSHFFVSSNLSYLLDNLELNGFISTYNKIKDKNNIFSNVYSLDYGLCKKYSMIYGRPGLAKSNSHILPTIFNFSNLIVDYFNSTQVIRCEKGHEFPYSDIVEFRKFKMNCPTCMDDNVFSKCQITMKFADLKKTFLEQEESEKLKITFIEFIVLNFLKTSQNSISFQRLSSNLDIAPSTVPNLIDRLTEKGWTELDVDRGTSLGKDLVKITSKGVRMVEKIEKIVGEIKLRKVSL